MAGSMLPEAVARSYSGALDALLPELPPAEQPSRQAQLAAFLESGFPHKRLEDWRYTDLSGLAKQTFALPADVEGRQLQDHFLPGTDRLVFVNGRVQERESTVDPALIDTTARSEPSPSDGIANLNASLGRRATALRIPPRHDCARPIHVLNICVPGATPSMLHLQHLVRLEQGSSATLIFEELSPEGGSHLVTQSGDLELADAARLELARISHHGDGIQVLNRWSAVLARDAALEWTNLDNGGALVRNDLAVALDAPGADVRLSGVYAPNGTTHIDNHSCIEHRQPHGRSRQTYRGIVDGKAHAVFNGRIVVHRGADKTDSEQHVANLLLTPQAEVNAKPELQIDNDDVKCAHGATCGQLDENALYYLRSRGIPLGEARQLMLFSFADEVIGKVACELARHRMRSHLLSVLPGGSRLEELQ